MGKNITVYITDELLEKMSKFKEVNWSEIARRGIEDYVEGREISEGVTENIVEEFQSFLDSFDTFTKGAYSYSIISLYQDFPADISSRERNQFRELFGNLESDFGQLKKEFASFKEKREVDNFKRIIDRFLTLVQRYSRFIKTFSSLVTEKTTELKPKVGEDMSRGRDEYPDTNYSIFREKFNYFVMTLNHFIDSTKSFHGRHIEDWQVVDMLAPRLFQFRLYTKKPQTG